MSRFDTVESFLSARPVTTEPDWGALQDAYRVLRSFGYAMARRRGGAIMVDGHRLSAAQVREMAERLRAGRLGWQQANGRAA